MSCVVGSRVFGDNEIGDRDFDVSKVSDDDMGTFVLGDGVTAVTIEGDTEIED